jgi:spermidine synthase
MMNSGWKRWSGAAGVLVVAAAAWAQTTAPTQTPYGTIVYEVPSQYQKITVVDTPGGMRQMIFDAKYDWWDAIQSEMNKANPLDLTLAYSRHMVASLALVEKPKRILIVGLGGACLQRYLHEKLPETRIDTAELDPVVRTVAQKYFDLKEDARQVVTIGDGRKFIEQSKDKYDVVMLDAFSATSIPYMLSTKEFLEVTKAHLADGGLVAANLWENQADYANMLKTYDAVFAEWHLVRCAGSTNVILTALPVKKDITVAKWMGAATVFEKTYNTSLLLPNLVERGFVVDAKVPAGAKVLLDKDEPKEN